MAGVLRSSIFLVKGIREFGKEGYARASKTFDDSVMARSLKGKTAIVTGANQGIGLQTAQELARRGCTLHMVCRNEAKGQEARDKVVQASGNQDVHLKVCDVSSLESVRKLAAEYGGGGSLHVLVCNAGILAGQRDESADGFEKSFATNTLGTFALANLLLPALQRGAAGKGSGGAFSDPSRIIIVSSGGQYTEPLVVDDLQATGMKSYDGSAQYARDKRRQVALAERMSALWGGSGVLAVAMHPGWTETQGVKSSIPGFWKAFGSRFRSVEQGADTIVYLALEDGTKLEPGGFYLDRAPQNKHLPLAGTHYSGAQVDTLWQRLTAMAGLPQEGSGGAAAT